MGRPYLALRKDMFKSAGLRLRLGQAVAEVRSCALVAVIEVDGIHRTAHLRDLILLWWCVLLWLLLSRSPGVVTREELIDSLWWDQDLADTRTLDTHVKRLRRKMENDPAAPVQDAVGRGDGDARQRRYVEDRRLSSHAKLSDT